MGNALQDQMNARATRQLMERPSDSQLRFRAAAWQFFARRQIEERLFEWARAAAGASWFRVPLGFAAEGDELHVELPPLPEGFAAFAAMAEHEISERDKTRLLIALCEAIEHLHERGFALGFLAPEQVYFHPGTLEVLLDVQPYPSALPFVDHLLSDYPYILFSRDCRTHRIERAADFYAVGLLMQWMFLHRFPDEAHGMAGPLPAWLHPLCERLMQAPTSFLFAQEIANELRAAGGQPVLTLRDEPLEGAKGYLHRMEPPLPSAGQEQFRSFLRTEGVEVMALVTEDDAARTDVIRKHISEVFEHDLFLVVSCRDFPFATFREMVERSIMVALEFMPGAAQKFRSLLRTLNRLLRRHDEGDDMVVALSEWLFSMYSEVQPIFKIQSFYYMFEGCHEFDEDSQRVFLEFWKRYKGQLTSCHVIFSGRALPTLFPREMTNLLEIPAPDSGLYRQLLASMLGLADEVLLDRLTGFLVGRGVHVAKSRLLVEELIDQGKIELTRGGWRMTPAFSLADDSLQADRLIAERVASLAQEDLERLRTLACFPPHLQIRVRSMAAANGHDHGELNGSLSRLSQLGLLTVYHEDSVFVPEWVVEQVLPPLREEERQAYYRSAIKLQRTYRPQTLPILIQLSRQSGDLRMEYFFQIQYYRQVRSMLSYERKRTLLEAIQSLQERLERTKIRCWKRLLFFLYYRLNLLEEAEHIVRGLYDAWGEPADRFQLMRILMFKSGLNLEQARQEAMDCLTDPSCSLKDKVQAAMFVFRSDIYLPLHKEGADLLYRFYNEDVYPNRGKLSTRLFADVTIYYTIALFQHFPEHEDSATVLLEMLEAILEDDYSQSHLMPLIYEAYSFHSNVSIGRKYIQRGIETARRSGFKIREQVCHVNGMEMALWQGDVAAYRFHTRSSTEVDEIRRKDLREQFLLHQLVYACEWEHWGLFDAVGRELVAQKMTPFTKNQWDEYERYAAYRRGAPLPPLLADGEDSQSRFFINALYAASVGRLPEACTLFQRSIAANGYQLTTGWSYRELVELLLQQSAPETGEWLDRFEQYLKKYSHDVFWPDLYRFRAQWLFCRGDFQRAILYLRRAANAYQLIEKEQCRALMNEQLEQEVQPAYLPADAAIRQDPLGQKLLDDRVKFLNHSLDLLVIIQLSEMVTESLEMDVTMGRLITAFFEYFPVMQVAVHYDLFHRKEKAYHSVSGAIHYDEYCYKWYGDDSNRHDIMIYQSGAQSIRLELNVHDLSDMARRHLEHFVAVIRPHIANAIHYMEMMIDTLTGFYQRRYFAERLKDEMDVSQRYGLDLSLIMLDIDNFRTVNMHGHQEGDKVLREMADIVRALLRKNDIPGRYGGEEILLILPKTDGQTAWKLANKLREQIEEEYATGRPYKVTVSVGVSSLSLNGATTVDELIFHADNAEIVAKTTGKNKVVASWLLEP